MGYAPFTCQTYLDAPIAPSLIPTCYRKLWMHEGQIVYLLFSPSQELLQCRIYESTGMVGAEVFMRLVLEKEALFEAPFMGCQVFWGGAASLLMPNELHDNLQELRLMRLHVDQDLGPERLRRQPVNSHNATLVFDVPEVVDHMLEHYVKYYELHHVLEPLIRSSDSMLQIAPSHILLLLSRKEVSVIVRKNKVLMLCQRYKTNARTDVLYYVQAIRRVVGLANDCAVFALGQIGIPFPEAEPLHHHIPGLKVPVLPLTLSDSTDAALPHWAFSFVAQ